MKIVITSGGTSEKIDAVRSITNHSSGRLGKEIVQLFLDKGHEVTLVTTSQTVKPSPHQLLTTVIVSNVASLLTTIEPLVKTSDVLIHSMAVSDYTPVYMTDLDDVEKTDHISDLVNRHNTERKISSRSDYQVLFLKKTPKIIRLVKQWNPNIVLVGFKLLVDVSKKELLSVARASLLQTHADYILANDLTEISDNQHHGILVTPDQSFTAETKSDIAQLIYEKVTQND